MKKGKKSILEERENYLKTNYIVEIPSKGLAPCKILGTILKVDQRRTSTNGPEN